jgi:DNA-binding HxlR family transcriptional regulator
MDIRTRERLAALFHHRWAVPILARLHRDAGAKFVTLAKRLHLSRDTLSATLAALIEYGWVLRNPGYGHPLRPEYILTPNGAKLGPWCVRAMYVLNALGARDVCLRKWSIPVAFVLAAGRVRFSEVRNALPDLTARALTLTLKRLQAAGLVERIVSHEYPPATYYLLTPCGRRLHRLAHAF